MSNDPAEQKDPYPLTVAVRLSPRAQASTLLEVAERCADIVDDIDTFPGSADDGRLLGIRAVADQQRVRLENVAANIMTDNGLL